MCRRPGEARGYFMIGGLQVLRDSSRGSSGRGRQEMRLESCQGPRGLGHWELRVYPEGHREPW